MEYSNYAETIKRPVLRYHGGKWKIAPWIIEQFPPHDVYVEPFGGAASVLLRKKRAPIEVYNDQWERIVTFFRVLREQPNELISLLSLTPWSRSEYGHSYESTGNELEDARRFFVQSWQGVGGIKAIKGKIGQRGWRYLTAKCDQSIPKWDGLLASVYAVATRMRGVQIECDDAKDVMLRFDGPASLHYVDPPYTADTRKPGHKQAYFLEMTQENHVSLAAFLHGLEGTVILSGYPSPLYRKLYFDWHRIERIFEDNSHNKRVEALWINRNCIA